MSEKAFIVFLFVIGIIMGILSSYFEYLTDNPIPEKPKEEEDKEPELIRPEALEKFIK